MFGGAPAERRFRVLTVRGPAPLGPATARPVVAVAMIGALLAVAAPTSAQAASCSWERGLTQAGSPPGVAEPDDALGSAIAVGDFDGDGAPDVATGVPGENSDSGAVSIFYAPCSGRAPAIVTQKGPIPGRSEADDRFGAALASGDFDDDGFDDLAIGIPGEDIGSVVDAGSVAVIYGSSSGLRASDSMAFSQRRFNADLIAPGAELGFAVAAGDVNGDGADDLVVGQPGRLVGGVAAGAVTVALGGPLGVALETAVHYRQGADLRGLPEAGDRFGAAVALGDFDNDGDDDLAVGAPGETVGGIAETGVIHVLTGALRQVIHQDTVGVPGIAETGDGFGTVLAAGDIDGDGDDDLAIGLPAEDIGRAVDAGAVVVLKGRSNGVDVRGTSWSQAALGVTGAAESGDRFGAALAVADVDGDGRADLVVGVPGESVGGSDAAGVVQVLPGRPFPGTGPIDVLLTQNTREVPGVRESGDGFGGALATTPGTVFAGASGEALGSKSGAGVVIPFDYSRVTTWARIADLVEEIERVGQSVSLRFESDDGLIVEYDGDRSLVPASNQKVPVAIGAYELLPPDFRYFTEVIADPDGNLYLVASGDPTLTRTGLRELAEQVVEARPTPVDDVVVVVGRYDDMRLAPGVRADNMPTYTGPMSELQVSDNRYRTDSTFLSEPDRENIELFARYLDEEWAADGGSGGYVDGTARVGSLPGAGSHVTSVASAPRDEMVADMLTSSDNQIADGLVREIAAQHTGFGTLETGLELIAARLEALGAERPQALMDGSGLSYTNFMSADAAVSFVRAAEAADWFGAYRAALPVAGQTGTLKNRLGVAPTGGNLRAKTGSLFISRSLAGLLTDAGGDRVRFAVIVNGTSVTTVNGQIDAIVTLVTRLD